MYNISQEDQEKLKALAALARGLAYSLENSTTLDSMDLAIDQWNVIINRVPSLLKRIKLELLLKG